MHIAVCPLLQNTLCNKDIGFLNVLRMMKLVLEKAMIHSSQFCKTTLYYASGGLCMLELGPLFKQICRFIVLLLLKHFKTFSYSQSGFPIDLPIAVDRLTRVRQGLSYSADFTATSCIF